MYLNVRETDGHVLTGQGTERESQRAAHWLEKNNGGGATADIATVSDMLNNLFREQRA